MSVSNLVPSKYAQRLFLTFVRMCHAHQIILHDSIHSTCFNRIDLPMYEMKKEVKKKLKLAVTMVATGFDIE
jgi:hypothetical protein